MLAPRPQALDAALNGTVHTHTTRRTSLAGSHVDGADSAGPRAAADAHAGDGHVPVELSLAHDARATGRGVGIPAVLRRPWSFQGSTPRFGSLGSSQWGGADDGGPAANSYRHSSMVYWRS